MSYRDAVLSRRPNKAASNMNKLGKPLNPRSGTTNSSTLKAQEPKCSYYSFGSYILPATPPLEGASAEGNPVEPSATKWSGDRDLICNTLVEPTDSCFDMIMIAVFSSAFKETVTTDEIHQFVLDNYPYWAAEDKESSRCMVESTLFMMRRFIAKVPEEPVSNSNGSHVQPMNKTKENDDSTCQEQPMHETNDSTLELALQTQQQLSKRGATAENGQSEGLHDTHQEPTSIGDSKLPNEKPVQVRMRGNNEKKGEPKHKQRQQWNAGQSDGWRNQHVNPYWNPWTTPYSLQMPYYHNGPRMPPPYARRGVPFRRGHYGPIQDNYYAHNYNSRPYPGSTVGLGGRGIPPPFYCPRGCSNPNYCQHIW